MKNLLITLLLLTSELLFAPSTEEITVVAGEKIQPYEKLWEAVCMVESGMDARAYHLEYNGHASIGIAQIQQSRVDDYNKQTGKSLSLKDCYDPAISKSVFMYYVSNDLEETARRWNGGPDGMKKESTIEYWRKVQKHLN